MLVCWGRYISKEENGVVTEQTVGQKCRLVQNKMLQIAINCSKNLVLATFSLITAFVKFSRASV